MRICEECGLHYTLSDTHCGVDGGALTDSQDMLLGETIGSYRIVQLLGEGGMGRVYLGLQPSIQSRVAIKVLNVLAASDPKTQERFFAEAKAVSRIRHDGIVKVLDLNCLPDGRPYIVMEHLDGQPLSGYLNQDMLPLMHVQDLVTQILDALDAVHAVGIVHRDLKPDNIFVSPQGRIKLLDFGIAKLLPSFQDGPLVSQTRTGAMLGTPHYMAPEQVEGFAIAPSADIYSVGAILYRIVTGQTVFQSDSLFGLLACVVSDSPVNPREYRSEISDPLQGIILKALEKDPSRRFQSAREMSDALRVDSVFSVGHARSDTNPDSHVFANEHSVSDGLMVPEAPATALKTATSLGPSNRGRIALGVIALFGGSIALAFVVGGNKGDKNEVEKLQSSILVVGDKLPQNTVVASYSHSAPDFDVSAFDAKGYLPRARKLAERIYPDAKLTGFDMPAVFPNGTTDLTMGDFDVTYNFLSGSHSARTKPIGMEEVRPCWVYVEVNKDGVTARIVKWDDCEGISRPDPKCSVKQVWQKAIKMGAPKHNVVADMNYLKDGWFFDISALKFTKSIPDDC